MRGTESLGLERRDAEEENTSAPRDASLHRFFHSPRAMPSRLPAKNGEDEADQEEGQPQEPRAVAHGSQHASQDT